MAPKELLALRLLMDNPQGLYASELVHLSRKGLGRGTVYMLLERMDAKRWVRLLQEEPSAALQLKRTRYFATELGVQACEDFAAAHGLRLIPGAFTSSA